MANALSSFDPVGSFQTARSNALTIAGQEADAALQPQRNELASLNLQKAKQGLQAGQLSSDQQRAATASRFIVNSNQALLQIPLEQRAAALQSLVPQAQQAGIDLGSLDLSRPLTDDVLNNAIQSAGTILQTLQGTSTQTPDAFTLSPGQKRFSGSEEIASVPLAEKTTTTAEAPVIPAVLLTGLDNDVAAKGAAAFEAAGGGKDGLTAFNKVVDSAGESQRREASPQILKTSFPNASPAELEQLQSSMDAAKTTEAGLEAAAEVREKQRQTKKAQVFQVRALNLMNSILDNPELGDVVGGIEGRRGGTLDSGILPTFLSDGESNAIADIEEAQNILTADNLDIMTGVLSETDIGIIKSLAGGALNRTRGEDRFITDLTKLRDKIASEMITTVDDDAAAGNDVKRNRLAELRAKAQQ